MTSIIEAGAVVSDRQFLNLFDSARVVNGNRSVVAQRMEKKHLIVGKALHGAVNQLDNTEHPVFRLQRHADDGARLPLCHFVNTFGEAGIAINVRNKQRFTVFCHPAGDAFADF